MVKQTMIAVTLCALITGLAAFSSASQHKKNFSADDYIEIQQLYTRYNMAIDSGDAEGWASTFVTDGVFNTTVGHDALVQFVRDWHNGRGANLRHWNTNLSITPTADGADGAVYLLLLNVGQRPPMIASAAKYEDQLVKTPDGWRFKKRVTKGEGSPPPAAAAKQ